MPQPTPPSAAEKAHEINVTGNTRMKKPTLGRGLADLLGQAVARPTVTPGPGDELARLPLDLLQRGRYQPRTDMRTDTLTELADSIRAQGVVQPIVVRALEPSAGGAPGSAQRYEIIAGERRWRAAQMAGLTEIPAVVRRIPDSAAIAVALIENIQRENLNPLEEARALTRLISEFGLTHQEAADSVGRSRAGVSNLLRLLELPAEVVILTDPERQLRQFLLPDVGRCIPQHVGDDLVRLEEHPQHRVSHQRALGEQHRVDLVAPGGDVGFPLVVPCHLFGDVLPKRRRVGEIEIEFQ